MDRFYRRADAVQAAKKMRYRSGRTSAYEEVTDAIQQGMTSMEVKPGGRIILSNPQTGAALQFSRTPETNLIRTLLNVGDFAVNY